jgi:hypothetical protein
LYGWGRTHNRTRDADRGVGELSCVRVRTFKILRLSRGFVALGRGRTTYAQVGTLPPGQVGVAPSGCRDTLPVNAEEGGDPERGFSHPGLRIPCVYEPLLTRFPSKAGHCMCVSRVDHAPCVYVWQTALVAHPGLPSTGPCTSTGACLGRIPPAGSGSLLAFGHLYVPLTIGSRTDPVPGLDHQEQPITRLLGETQVG